MQESCLELAGPSSRLETCLSLEEDMSNVKDHSPTSAARDLDREEDREDASISPSSDDNGAQRGSPQSSVPLSPISRSSQTQIQLKDMRSMFSLVNIHIGCSVMLYWHKEFGTYVIHCKSPMLHFVKHGCMSKFGIDLKSDASPRPSGLLGVVATMDTCKIVKEKNRFNLPIDTKIVQVSVEPLT